LAPHELPPRQILLTIRPERPSGPYFIDGPPETVAAPVANDRCRVSSLRYGTDA